MNTKYGLVCISKILKEEDPSNSFVGLNRKAYTELSSQQGDEVALNKLKDEILHNLNLTVKIVDFCRDSGIDHYRLNTSIFGLISDPSFGISFGDLPNNNELMSAIREIGRTSITKGVSLSIQPDKFCKLIDDDEDVVEKSIKEIDFYSWFLDSLGMPENLSAPVSLHLNSQPSKNDHDAYCDFVDRFYENFKRLSASSQKRLVLKNADNGSWSAFNLFKYLHVYCYEEHDFGFPLAYNNLFDVLNPSKIDKSIVEQQINIGAFHETWSGVVPVFTWTESESAEKPRAYAKELSQPIPDFGYQVKWEVDVTDKDIAIIKLFDSDDPSRISEEALRKITRGKYEKVTNNYNALYEAARQTKIVPQSGEGEIIEGQ
jgi:UV DNA damage repair endonuclease